MGETAEMVEYRLTRPDGNLIYHEVVSSQMDFGWHVPADGCLNVGLGLDGWISPPWRLQRRASGEDWTTVSEMLTP